VEPVALFPQGGGLTKYLLTETSASCRFINLGLFFADPGQGSQWLTHPLATEEEAYLYIIEGRGTLFYRQNGRTQALPFEAGQAIFAGHLTQYVWNTGAVPLKIYFSIAPLPERTLIHAGSFDDHEGHVDSASLEPPLLVRPEAIPLSTFTKGGLVNRRMLFPESVGARHGRVGTALETPGQGSFWHTHPQETGEEDLFYTISGTGTMVYVQDGVVKTFPFGPGDAIHSHHLTNYTMNPGDEDLVMLYSGAPHPGTTLTHDFVPDLA